MQELTRCVQFTDKNYKANKYVVSNQLNNNKFEVHNVLCSLNTIYNLQLKEMQWQVKLTEEFGSFWIDLFEFAYRNKHL